MRLEEIVFHRVGLWSGLPAIRFGPRLTIVLGDNEAGKTTAMRAIEALLFGPSRALVAPLPSEQLFHASATARLPDGTSLSWTRRGRAIEPADAADALPNVLPPDWAPRFRDLFRLHSNVRADEAAFLSESGALGRALVAVSSGASAAALAAAEKRLQERLSKAESGAQGSDGLRLRLRDLGERREALVRAAKFDAWERQSAQLAELDAQIEALSRRIGAVGEQHRRLVAYARGLEDWRRLGRDRARLEALAALGPVPPRSWPQQIELALVELRNAGESHRAAVERCRRSQVELDGSPEASPVAAFLDEVERLAERAAASKQRGTELQARVDELADTRRELRELLSRFGAAPDEANLLHESRARTVPSTRRTQLLRLLEQGDRARTNLRQSRQLLADAEQALESARKSAGEVRHEATDGLQQALDLASRAAELETRIEETAGRERESRNAASRLCAALGLAHLGAEQVASLALADRPRIDEAFKRLQEAERAHEAAESKRREAERIAAEASAAAEKLHDALGRPPTEAELLEARAARGEAWAELKQVWSPRFQPDQEARLPALVGAFEARLERADEIADRRYTDAERIGKWDAARSAAAEAARQFAETDEQLAVRRAEKEAASAAWRELWSMLSAPPVDHRAWLADHGRAVDLVASARDAGAEQQALTARRDALLDDARALVRVELPQAAGLSSCDALIGALQAELTARRARNDAASRAASRVETLTQQCEASRREAERAAKACESWEEEWSEEVSALASLQERSTEAVRSWLQEQERLELLVRNVERIEAAVSAAREAVRSFEADAADLLGRVRAEDPALPLSSALAPIDAIRELQGLARNARDLRSRRSAAEKALRERTAEVAECAAAVALKQAALEERWRSAGQDGVPTDDAVAAVLQRAGEYHALEDELAKRTASLEREWWMGVETAVEEIADRSAEELDSTAVVLERDRRQLEQERDEALQQRGSVKQAMKLLESPHAEADRVQELAHAQTRVLEKAEEVASLRAALWLLEQARLRAANASQPLVELASGHFRRLTEGAYEALVIDREGKQPRLFAVPTAGPARNTSELSDGTLDQIWLSLRLAVAGEAAAQTPMPLVLDDVFVHFDDRRTTAALKLLAELAESHQVILFTHHDHVVDLARAALADALTLVVLARPELARERVLPEQRERIPRPPAPPLQLELAVEGDQSARSSPAIAEACERVIRVLELSDGPLSKNELIDAVRTADGVDLGPAWSGVIKQLKADGRVEQKGEKRGARYALARADGESASTG